MKYFYVSLLTLVLPTVVCAATISFDPQEKEVGMNSPFTVAVNVTADAPVNTIALKIKFSKDLEPVDVANGNSIIPLWVDKPQFDVTTGVLSFSGIIPRGFSGTNARLVTLSVRAKAAGEQSISVLPSSDIFLNTADGQRDIIQSTPLSLFVQKGKDNITNQLPDTFPPEPFVPQMVSLTTEHGVERVLVFSTTDKGSGVDHYEVREFNPYLPLFNTEFRRVDSPYVLRDQAGRNEIVIRAFDARGNVQEVRVGPLHSALIETVFSIALLCVLAILLYVGITRII